MKKEQPQIISIRRHPVIGMRMILSLAVSLLVSVTVIGVSWIAEHNAREVLHLEMQTHLLLEARHLALLSADALLTDFPELTLCPVVRKMQEERGDMAFAVVLDHAGLVKGHVDPRRIGQNWKRQGNMKPLSTTIQVGGGEMIMGNGELMMAQVPVRHVGGRRIGSAVVGLNRSHLEAMVTRARRELILVTAALLAMAVLLAVLLMRRLLGPVAELQRGLERIGRGDLDTPMHLKDGTELGQLADTVNEMARQVKDSQKEMLAKDLEIIETQAEVIHTLGEVVENRSHETANHTVRVGQYAYLLGTLTGLDEDEARLLKQAAPMHDIGKIGIPDAVLNKPGSYNDEEREIMKQHAAIGFSILARSKRDVLQAAAVVAHQHHERWDGTGYPRGLAGYDIHIFGRIVAIADVFDALSFDRVYRRALSQSKVLDIMRAGRGTQFDPHLLDLFMENMNDFVVLKSAYDDGQARLSPEQKLAIASALGPVEQMETETSEDQRVPVEI